MNFKQLYERLIQRVSSDINKSIDVIDKGVATAATIFDMPIGDMMIKKITEFNDAVRKLCNFKDDSTKKCTDNELILYTYGLPNKHDGSFYLCFDIKDVNSPSIYKKFVRVYYRQEKNIRVYFEQGPKIEDSDIAKSDTYVEFGRRGGVEAASFMRVYKINDLSGVVKSDQYDKLFKLIKIMYDNRYEINNYVQSIDDIIEQDKGAYIDKFMIPLLEKNNYDFTIE
jgi:hypothetical protein